MKNVLECDGITLQFDLKKVLSSIYIKCETGEIVGLLGRNGSGKSCLMKVIVGALEVESKSIRMNGRSIGRIFSDEISYLPQHNFIPSFLTIEDAFKVYGIGWQHVEEFFPEFLNQLQLKSGQLSGGTLRIFEVILVASLPSKFILMDEPFSGIMPIHIDTMKKYFLTVKANKGIILTDHLYRHITSLADQIYVLANGKTYLIKDEEQIVQYGYLKSL